MQFTTTTLLAISALLPAISAHLIMHTPPQWTVPGEAQAPLAADGSDFPCQDGTPGESSETYAPGTEQTLQLIGSAVHGGGSGQMLITYDTNPTKDSVFRVMQSWEGNHPIQADGNLPADPTHVLPALSFKVPKGLKAGKAVVAWSWFNHIGNREHYMKCSTVTISGDETSDAGFNALPTMLKANDGQTGCTVQPDVANSLKFKNPGPVVIGTGTQTLDCDDSEAGTDSSSSYQSGSSSDTSSASSGSASSAPVASSAAVSSPSEAATSVAPVASSPAETSAVAAPTAAASSVASAAPATPSSTSSSGSCTEGEITCTSTSTWSLCGSGAVHDMGAVPAGMQCSGGAIVAIAASGTAAASPATTSASYHKRGVRFSPAHMRRRHSGSVL